jgi:hypothetical protein
MFAGMRSYTPGLLQSYKSYLDDEIDEVLLLRLRYRLMHGSGYWYMVFGAG